MFMGGVLFYINMYVSGRKESGEKCEKIGLRRTACGYV